MRSNTVLVGVPNNPLGECTFAMLKYNIFPQTTLRSDHSSRCSESGSFVIMLSRDS